MRKLLILFILITPSLGFSQDPHCEYVIKLLSVNDSLYSYKFLLDDSYDEHSIDWIKKNRSVAWDNFEKHRNAIYESENNNQIQISYIYKECNPSGEKNQFRIIIARKNEITEIVELMYTYSASYGRLTEIIVPQFQIGERKNETFIARDLNNQVSRHNYGIFNKRLIIIE